MNDERQMYIQAVLDGQLSGDYVTDKELMSVYLRMFDKITEKHLPHFGVKLH